MCPKGDGNWNAPKTCDFVIVSLNWKIILQIFNLPQTFGKKRCFKLSVPLWGFYHFCRSCSLFWRNTFYMIYFFYIMRFIFSLAGVFLYLSIKQFFSVLYRHVPTHRTVVGFIWLWIVCFRFDCGRSRVRSLTTSYRGRVKWYKWMTWPAVRRYGGKLLAPAFILWWGWIISRVRSGGD